MSIGMNPMSAGKSSGLKGTGYNQVSIPTKTKGQGQLWEQLYAALGGDSGGLSKGLSHMGRIAAGDPSAFEEMEKPAYDEFDELMSQLSNRFTEFSPGAMSSRKGSGFQHAGNTAAAKMAERLASNRMKLRMGATESLQKLSQDLLGENMFNSMLQPKKRSFWEKIKDSFANKAGDLVSGIGKDDIMNLIAAVTGGTSSSNQNKTDYGNKYSYEIQRF